MNFSKLSEETMDLSNNIGPRQQKLLFDHEFFDEEVTLRQDSSSSKENSLTNLNDLCPVDLVNGPKLLV